MAPGRLRIGHTLTRVRVCRGQPRRGSALLPRSRDGFKEVSAFAGSELALALFEGGLQLGKLGGVHSGVADALQ